MRNSFVYRYMRRYLNWYGCATSLVKAEIFMERWREDNE